jgi:hypothetical protein
MFFDRIIGHALHILRGQQQGFKPLTEAQYDKLCAKIERTVRRVGRNGCQLPGWR